MTPSHMDRDLTQDRGNCPPKPRPWRKSGNPLPGEVGGLLRHLSLPPGPRVVYVTGKDNTVHFPWAQEMTEGGEFSVEPGERLVVKTRGLSLHPSCASLETGSPRPPRRI